MFVVVSNLCNNVEQQQGLCLGCLGVRMNFQKLIGILRNWQDNQQFDDLESESTTHILLTGPPASAKTTFLMSSLQHLKNAYFIDGGNATKAGIIDYLFEDRPRYLLIDEIDKLGPEHQTFLLNLMETGVISETKFGKTREARINTSILQPATTLGNCRPHCSLDSSL